MDFLVYSRDAAGVEALRGDRDLLERHWSYMDAFADTMVARGPTCGPDGGTVTGSLHIVGLPSTDAALEFVEQEPNNQAGVYAEHLVRRFENLLGRTMWEFQRTTNEPMFFVLAPSGGSDLPDAIRRRLIFHGALSGLDDAEPAGVALALQSASVEAAVALLRDAGLGDLEVHRWEFGGRR